MIFTWQSLIGWRKRYLNPHHKSYHPSSIYDAWTDFSLWLKEVILWITGFNHDPQVLTRESAALKILNEVTPKETDLSKPLITWVNHSSFWLSCQNIHFLTDPIWSERCTPVAGFGPKRKHPVPFNLSALTNPDFILISHNHYDHLDKPTISYLNKLHPDLIYMAPAGCKNWLSKRGVKNIYELNWWQNKNFEIKGQQLRITAVPAQHFSGREVFDINDTLWCGWVVEFFSEKWRQKSFYFCGDTGYNPIDFREIGRLFGPFDLSLIPIGAYLPRKIMANIHINPYEALLVHKDVQSNLSVGCHYHTFELAQEHMSQPPYDLLQAMNIQKIPKEQFLLLDIGQTINW
jgi:N-acyl-phosphatidylethanolamine-hydrolysing phospholipase D